MKIVADVGGTKTYLALLDENNSIRELTSFHSQNYPTFSLMVVEYLAKKGNPLLTSGCFAIAGPIVEGKSHLTNLKWDISAKALEEEFSIPKIFLLNDLRSSSLFFRNTSFRISF